MDLNQFVQFTSSSSPLTQVHNFMNIPPTTIIPPSQQLPNEVEEDNTHSRLQLQKQNLQLFWQEQMLAIYHISELKHPHQLPLARIKRIMKSNEEVKMISTEAPILFSKACELFILELTLRSWLHTEEKRRRTLQRKDIASAVTYGGEALKFLLDIIPTDDDTKEEGTEKNTGGTESLTSNGLHFPMMDLNHYHQNLNGDFMARQQELPQQFMMPQPMSSTQLIYEPEPLYLQWGESSKNYEINKY